MTTPAATPSRTVARQEEEGAAAEGRVNEARVQVQGRGQGGGLTGVERWWESYQKEEGNQEAASLRFENQKVGENWRQ